MFSLDVLQAEAKRDLTNEILESMENYLDNSQLMELNRSINQHLNQVQVYHHNNTATDFEERNKALVEEFIRNKKLSGLSKNTISYYNSTLQKYLRYCDKLILDYKPEDIREFLSFYKELNNCSNVSLNNVRRILSTFYEYLHTEEYILKNPMKAVNHIKEPKRIKKPFTSEEIEIMRKTLIEDYDYRDLAIFELLLSSGVRLSELASLNREDIDFETQTFNVIGKGNKERKCYFGTKAKMALKDYLKTRTDKSPALFITLNKSHGGAKRLGISGIGTFIRELGLYCGIKEAHPHKFRRTFATNLLNRKMPLEQIQKLLGHDNINTTMIYVNIDEEEIKLNYQKYIK